MTVSFFITGHYNNQSNEGIKYSQQGGYFRFLNVFGEIDEPVQFSPARPDDCLMMFIII